MDAQLFERLLARYERIAGKVPRLERLEKEHLALLRTLETAQAANRRHERDLKAAEAKINEWAEYASQLRSAIEAARQRKKIVLPDMPGPFETEILF